jgi:membrane-associated phospholipid phosphatase
MGLPFPKAYAVHSTPRRKVQALQSNVRGVLVEMELLKSIQFFQADDGPHVGLKLASSGAELVRLGKLDDTVFDRQLKLVQSYAALRAERSAEVLTQVVPQVAHWSSIAALSPERHRTTWELIGFGLRFTMMMVMRLKYELNVQRPWERSALVQPMILTPGYTAFPSGHATEASFVAELLPLLAGDPTHPCIGGAVDRPDGMARQLNRLAFRIAENRVVAGLHYPVDSIAGHVLGAMLARYVVWLASGAFPDIREEGRLIGAQAFPQPDSILGDDEEPDFDRFVDDPEQRHVLPPGQRFPDSVPEAPVLRELWTLARREWAEE